MSEKISLSNPPVGAPQGEAVPSEAIALPSEGKLYPPNHPLHGKQYIEIRPMTARDEDILTSRALFKTGRVIEALLRSCILDKNIDPNTMLVGDRNAAIIGIRVSGYGADYTTTVECPSCATKSQIELDLGMLPLRNLPEDAQPTANFTNEFAFKCSMSGKNVVFRIPVGADEQELSTLIDRMRKTTGSESLVTSRLMQQIVSIDGETDRAKLSQIIRNLPAKDSRDIRAEMDYVSPDVSLIASFKCQSCEYEAEEVPVPLGTEFFWPKAGR
jgi:hypothetical protein